MRTGSSSFYHIINKDNNMNYKFSSIIEVGKPKCYKIIKKCNDIIILQPMKQKANKPGKSSIKQKSLRQIVLEGFKRQEKFNRKIINRLDNLVKKNNLKE